MRTFIWETRALERVSEESKTAIFIKLLAWFRREVIRKSHITFEHVNENVGLTAREQAQRSYRSV